MEDRKAALEKEVHDLECRIIQVSQLTTVEDGNERDESIYLQLLKNLAKDQSAFEIEHEKELHDLQRKLDEKEQQEGELRDAFHSFRRSITSAVDPSSENQERQKLGEIAKARLSFLRTKLDVKRLEKKFAAKEASDESLDVLGFEQLQKDNTHTTKQNEDRDKELDRFKAMHRGHIAALNTAHVQFDEATQGLEEKREMLKVLDAAIQQKRKRRDQLVKKQDLSSNDNLAASREVVKLNYLKSEEEMIALKTQIQDLKECFASLTEAH